MSEVFLPIMTIVAGLLVGIAGVATLLFRKRLAANLAKLPSDIAAKPRGQSYPILLGITQIILGVALVVAGVPSDFGVAASRGLLSGVARLPLLPGVVLASMLLVIGAGCISAAVPPLRRVGERLQADESDREDPDPVRRPRSPVMYASVLLILGFVAIGWAFIVGIALFLAGAI
jgi:hypothetical protein